MPGQLTCTCALSSARLLLLLLLRAPLLGPASGAPAAALPGSANARTNPPLSASFGSPQRMHQEDPQHDDWQLLGMPTDRSSFTHKCTAPVLTPCLLHSL